MPQFKRVDESGKPVFRRVDESGNLATVPRGVDPNAAIKAAQAAKYSTLSETGVTDNRLPGRVALDQTVAALKGGVKLVPGMVGAAYEGAGAIKDMALGRGSGRAQTMLQDTAAGMLQPGITVARGAAGGDVSRHEWEQAAEGAGANLAGLLLPKAPAATRAGLKAVTTADKLVYGAAGSRAAAASARTPSGVPTTTAGVAVNVAQRVVAPARILKAAAQERVARWMTKYDVNQSAGSVSSAPDTVVPKAQLDAGFEQSARRTDMRNVARDQSRPWSDPHAGASAEPLGPPSQPVSAERPAMSRFAEEDLARLRTQSAVDADAPRTKARSMPRDPLKVSFDTPETYADRPGIKASAAQKEPLAVPGDFGASATELSSGPSGYDIAATQKAIRPTGRAKESTLRNTPQLVAVAPELFPSTYETFPIKAVSKLQQFGRAIDAAESAVPRDTVVPRAPILQGLAELAEFYKNKLNPAAEAAVEKISQKWAALPENIPWEEFVKAKRAFFDSSNVNAMPMLRAYGHVMDASSKISPALSAANKNYSIVRRALSDAGVDIQTAQRIRDTGTVARPTTLRTGALELQSSPLWKAASADARVAALNALQAGSSPAEAIRLLAKP